MDNNTSLAEDYAVWKVIVVNLKTQDKFPVIVENANSEKAAESQALKNILNSKFLGLRHQERDFQVLSVELLA